MAIKAYKLYDILLSIEELCFFFTPTNNQVMSRLVEASRIKQYMNKTDSTSPRSPSNEWTSIACRIKQWINFVELAPGGARAFSGHTWTTCHDETPISHRSQFRALCGNEPGDFFFRKKFFLSLKVEAEDFFSHKENWKLDLVCDSNNMTIWEFLRTRSKLEGGVGGERKFFPSNET